MLVAPTKTTADTTITRRERGEVFVFLSQKMPPEGRSLRKLGPLWARGRDHEAVRVIDKEKR
jgi:hypothetical protein